MKTKKMVGFILVVCVGILLVNGARADTVKIGAILPLSGPATLWGIPIKKLYDLQAMEINKKGGISVGDKKYLIEFIMEDGKCTAADSLSAMKKLVFRDKVNFILGPICSTSAAAIVPILDENKILMVAPLCATDKWFSGASKYAFRTHVPAEITISAFLEWGTEKRREMKKIVFFNPNDETGKMSQKRSISAIADINARHPGRYEQLSSDWYERGTQDFRPLLMRVLANNPDLILGGGITPSELAVIIKESRELGYKGTMYSCNPLSTSYLVEIAGQKNCEGILGYGMDWEATPPLKKFYNDYKAYYHEEPLTIAGWGIDGLPLMVKAIEEAKSFDVDRVAKVLESWNTFPTYFGQAFWGGLKTFGVKHQICRPWHLAIIQGGKEVMIASPMGIYP